MWLTKHAPKVREDLAVNKKKVAEVSDWLDESFKGLRGLVPILLLSGDSGIGKTATIQVLAREKSVEIIEWINPTTSSTEFSSDPSSRSGWDRSLQVSSQTTQFFDFLLRVERYPTLSLTTSRENPAGKRKILLVEDFPNAFLHNYSQFHDCLRKFSRSGNTRANFNSITPAVFIVSGNTGSSSAAERGLFPENLQAELRLQQIRFNAVPTTAMMKALTRVVSTEGARKSGKDGGIVLPDGETLQEIIATSAGDIRSAINALEFRILGQRRNQTSGLTKNNNKIGSGVLKRSRTVKSTRKKVPNGSVLQDSEISSLDKNLSINEENTGRDSGLSLFHALGKLFYCKRKPHAISKSPKLPTHLSQHQRDELTFDPDGIIERVAISPEYFVSFLHQNYVDFYTTIEDVASAADCLSECDELLCDWSNRQMLRSYSSSVASRGVVFYNTARSHSDSKTPSIGWKPLHRPQCIDVAKKINANQSDAASIFSLSQLDTGLRLTGGSRMLVETLPYLQMLSMSTISQLGRQNSLKRVTNSLGTISQITPSSSQISLFTQRQLAFLRECVSLETRTRNIARLEKLDEYAGALAEDDDDAVVEGTESESKISNTVDSLSVQPFTSSDAGVPDAAMGGVCEDDEDEIVIDSYDD